VPLHSLDALEDNLQPSIARMFLPVKPISSHINKALRNNDTVSLSKEVLTLKWIYPTGSTTGISGGKQKAEYLLNKENVDSKSDYR